MASKDLAGQGWDDPVPAGQGRSGQTTKAVFISFVHCSLARPSCPARKQWIHRTGSFICLYTSKSQEEVACVPSPADGASLRKSKNQLQVFRIVRTERVTWSVLAAPRKVLSTPSRMEDCCVWTGTAIYLPHLGKAVTGNRIWYIFSRHNAVIRWTCYLFWSPIGLRTD